MCRVCWEVDLVCCSLVNTGSTLVHRLRRWPSIKPALPDRPILTGYFPMCPCQPSYPTLLQAQVPLDPPLPVTSPLFRSRSRSLCARTRREMPHWDPSPLKCYHVNIRRDRWQPATKLLSPDWSDGWRIEFQQNTPRSLDTLSARLSY